MPHLTPPPRWWLAAVAAGLAGTAEWIRAPRPGWAALVVIAAVAGLALVRPRRAGWARWALAAVLLAASVLVPLAQARVGALAGRWPEEREARIEAASRRLEGDLRTELRRIGDLARRVADLAGLPDEELFHALERAVPAAGVETGAVLFGPDGAPRAWAGEHRLLPVADGDSLAARFAAYAAVVETRRTLPDGSVAVATLLLDSDPAVPGPNLSLSERFRSRTEVGLEVFAPGAAPESGDVFDYEEPTTAGPRVLFSVRPVPPSQGEAAQRLARRVGQVAALGAIAVVILGLLVAAAPPERYLLLAGLVLLAVRSPVLDLLGLQSLASPSLFYRELGWGLGTVAGPLLLAGLLLVHLGVRLWREPGRRPPPVLALGALLLVAAPFVVRNLGQGITPPLGGVSIPLWLGWEVTLLLATTGLVVLAAGLLRRPAPSRGAGWPMAGAALAVTAAVVGVFVWEGRGGWPEWYTLLWLPALVMVTRPAARWATILGVATVAGSAAALMTWGAELEGRVELARRDLMHLGPEPELLAEPVLAGFAAEVRRQSPPADAADLFAAWRRAAMDRQGYPARLELRAGDGVLRAALVLDQLDLPDSLVVSSLATLPPGLVDTILVLPRTPGLHYLLLQRLAADTVLAVILGPRTELVPSARLGRLLGEPALRRPAYSVTLSPSPSAPGTESELVRWRREGWTIRGERTIRLPDGPRQAHASVEMLRPGPLLIRGALVLILNVVLLGLLWRVAELVAGDRLRWPAWRVLSRSFRAQLSVTLAAFFVVPVAGFAAWSVFRLNEEAAQDRRLAVTQVLRDVLAAGPGLVAGTPDLESRLAVASSQVDAELGVYQGDRLVGRTSAVLDAFGLLPPLMDPEAHHQIHLAGERDAISVGLRGNPAGAVGYRSFRPPAGTAPAVLATPQAAGDPALAERQLNLLLALLLASLLGVVAALAGAQAAARRLSRPVADLRQAALAFGEGGDPVVPVSEPPLEFQPVFAAFQRMVENVRANQEAQERAARVLAWGEMASQVAHEIKNPLTPMRLGIQHLQRVWRERRERFGPALDETAPRVLAEIDRLDRIARSFSRYGAPESGGRDLEQVDLARELAEVVPLYRAGESEMVVEVATGSAPAVPARRDEVKEVLLNLLENARQAGAKRVVLRAAGRSLAVQDDGRGMPAEMLERIFEPRFSTTTSGSGLGLAIVRRIVEGWGGTIGVESEPGTGTTFTIRFAAMGGAGPTG